MSRGAGLGQDRGAERDFVVASIEEFVKKFGGTHVINKVIFFHSKFGFNLTLKCIFFQIFIFVTGFDC